MNRIGVDMPISDDEGEEKFLMEDKLKKGVNRARIKQKILNLYKDIKLDIEYL